MKQTLIIFIALYFTMPLLAQDYTVIRKTYTVLPAQSIELNGGIRSQFGGKSRTTLPIELPQSTLEWYYSFTTSAVPGAATKLQLAAQLAAKLDPTGFASIAVDLLTVPEGVAKADIFLLD